MPKQILIISIAFLALASAAHANYALNFDGADDYVNVPYSASLNIGGGDFTIEAWVKRSAIGTRHNILENNSVIKIITLYVHSDNKVYGTTYEDGVNSTGVVSTSTVGTDWTHIAFVRSGTAHNLYINGFLDKTFDGTARNFNVDASLNIGRYPMGAEYFNGKMDEIRIWDTARTEPEIKADMYKEIGTHANLKAYYKMSNGSGTTLTDNSGSSNAGTINGAAWKASGSFAGPRKALDFDGTDDYVSIADNNALDLTTTYTIEAWIKPRTFHWLGGIVGKYHTILSNGYTLRLSNTNQSNTMDNSGIMFDSMSTSTGILTANQWQHIAAVNNNGTRKVYLNGVEQTLTGTPDTIQSNSDPVTIGKDYLLEAGTRYFDGEIDEVRIWNVARTPEQIRENMMNTLNGSEANLAAYYRMDQSDGLTLYDMTANANNGTLTNMDNADWIDSTAFNTWIGSENDAWATAGNWSRNSVPASTDNVGLYKLSSLANEVVISGTPTVNSLYFSSSATPTLEVGGFTVNGNLLLGVDLESDKPITLGSSANLVEGSYRLFGSGNITTTRSLSSITTQNVAGLGAVITTSADMGSTTITRSHTAQTISGNPSILRYYDITPTTNTGLNASLVFNYNDSELNGLTEADLKLWKSTDGGTNWSILGGTIDTANNTITLTGQDGFSRWTAAVPSSTYTVTLNARAWAGAGTVDSETVNNTTSPVTITKSVASGAATFFTITPSAGSTPAVTGCGGVLSGTSPNYTYTTDTISADCTVTATFTLNSYTVASIAPGAGSGGTITSSRIVNHGDTTTFTITPDWGYELTNLAYCGSPVTLPSLSGNIYNYTTSAVTADCTLEAAFALKTYTVTATAVPDTNGSISPSTRIVTHGQPAAFTVTADSGYTINYVLGCNGSLSGDTYTTGNITGDCKVMAFFKSQ